MAVQGLSHALVGNNDGYPKATLSAAQELAAAFRGDAKVKTLVDQVNKYAVTGEIKNNPDNGRVTVGLFIKGEEFQVEVDPARYGLTAANTKELTFVATLKATEISLESAKQLDEKQIQGLVR